MAKLNSTTVQDVTNKMSLGVLSTTNDKNYFEELYSWAPQLDKTDIFAVKFLQQIMVVMLILMYHLHMKYFMILMLEQIL